MTYGLVAIVRDEAVGIDRMLSGVRPLISAWTIVDTGSTDGTQELVRDALEGIPGTLLERPWVDFGHNRSEAFAAARGSADWLLALDADMTVEIDPGFEPDPDVAAYMIRMGTPDFEWRLPLVLRGDLPWESRGAVHEYTVLEDGASGRREPTDLVRITAGGTAAWTPAKGRWHAELLEAELERSPADPRATFYLAKTYRELGDPRALALFRLRSTLSGWDEETFVARYYAAQLEPEWPARIEALLGAWESRPHRLEPVHDALEELNRRGLHRLAYRIGEDVGDPSPTPDSHFVHRSVWTWGLDFQRSIAAWWMGDRDTFERLTSELLDLDLPAYVRARVEANAALPVPVR